MRNLFKCAFGGGNRGVARDIVRGADLLAAKQLGSGATHVALCNKIGSYFRHWCKVLAAKFVKDAKTIRRKDDKFVSGKIAICRYSDRLAKNLTNNNILETRKSYPSPEFLNSLSFIKKFYPLPFGARAKFRKGNHETEAIGRHSERLAKESSDTNNLIQLQGIKINSTETDHASMPLGIFTSELTPDVYFDFASKSVSRKTNVGGVGTPPYVAKSVSLSDWQIRPTSKNLAASLPNRLAAKKFAFTLAEVLITLGIIGVVAAMTLPTVIQNYQKQETVTRLKSTYSVLNQVYKISIAENGEPENWVPVGEISVEEYFNKYFKPYIKILKMCETYKDCGYKTQTPWIMLEGSQSQTSIGKYDNWVTCVLPNGTVILYMSFINENNAETTHTIVDLNGAKGPNRFGRDVFRFDRIKNIGFVPSGYNSTNIDCTKTTSGAGCAAKIMKDNWQISDDYPW